MRHQAKKKFGQNFLTDKNLLNKIVRLAQVENKNVIEVGPGQGALTTFLAESAKHVTAYEIDTSLKRFLNPLEIKYDNLDIIYDDFMKADLHVSEETHIVANVPYYITTPIIFKFLEHQHLKSATIMIQKEVADRINAKPNTKAYNNLSVLLQYFTKVEKLMDVKRHMFTPVPNVDSIVIKLTKRNLDVLNAEEEKLFIDIVKTAFTQKRKTLVNNLSLLEGIEKSDIITYLETLGFQANIRAEALTIDDFIKITKGWNL